MDLEAQARFDAECDDFLDHLRVERGASPHTVAAYASDLSRASTFFVARGRSAWDELTAEDLLAFRATLGAPMAARTAQRKMSAVRTLLKRLKRLGRGPDIDLPELGGIKLPKRLPKALSTDDLERLLDAPDLKTPQGMRDRALLELLYGAGLRISEALAVRTDAIDGDGTLRVTGKRDKTRVVPVPGKALEWIERYVSESRPKLVRTPRPELVLSNRGNAMHRSVAASLVGRLKRKAGIAAEVTPHTLRHTYAVHLLKGGADLRAVQELLGHASIATTEIYTQLETERVLAEFRSAHPRA